MVARKIRFYHQQAKLKINECLATYKKNPKRLIKLFKLAKEIAYGKKERMRQKKMTNKD